MADVTPSANMNMPIPVVGVAPGPEWASSINSCFLIVDQHNHTPGYGVPIVSAAINVNADLLINQFNLTLVKSLRFYPQVTPLAGPSDLGCNYVSGVDLYFNDGNGNQVRITQSGGVAGSPGSIASLASPASATYVSATPAFVWQSDVNTPANLDCGSVVIRNILANSKGCTLSCPAALGANYSLVLPLLPASTKIMALDASGNLSAPYDVDNSTLEINSNSLRVKPGGITTTQISATAGILKSQLAALGQQVSSSSGSFSTATSGSAVDVTNLTVTITTTGRPVFITLVSASTSGGYIKVSGSVASQIMSMQLVKDSVALVAQGIGGVGTPSAGTFAAEVPVSSFSHIDTPAAGTYVYKITVSQNALLSNTMEVNNAKLIAYEL